LKPKAKIPHSRLQAMVKIQACKVVSPQNKYGGPG
jgi:hypothetical protein